MPQDLALYEEFSIRETLTFFGRLHQMSQDDVEERIEFLVEFLNLPDKDALIRELRSVL